MPVARNTALSKTDCSLVGKRVIKQFYWVRSRRNVLRKHGRGNGSVEAQKYFPKEMKSVLTIKEVLDK